MTDWPSNEEKRDVKRQGQVNRHAFLAKLATYGLPKGDDQVRAHAGFTFRSTCEFAPWEKVHFPEIEEWYEEGDDEDEWREHRDRELELVSIRILNAKVPAAAQWIKYTCERVYEMKGELFGEYDWQEDSLNVKWKGEKGWSKERFRFWRERFEWMTTVTALEHSTKKIARECADSMKQIEEKH